MELLGWKISTGEDKRRPFSKPFEILRAVVAFPMSSSGVIEVRNKETRLEQLKLQVQELQQCLGSSMSRTKIESLKGRLLCRWTDVRRCAQLACQILHRLSGMRPLVTTYRAGFCFVFVCGFCVFFAWCFCLFSLFLGFWCLLFFVLHGDSSMDYVSIQFTSLLYHIVIMTRSIRSWSMQPRMP